MADRRYTADQITDAIEKALAARDMPAVVGLLRLLAIRDPARAQLIIDLIKMGGAE